ncbi:hypothetical protein FQN54_009884 [Arachnomyces sp. PD_36]|nr:hypothetical protein FQN54_009884 [Arachnomyces sp. PD_36]
MSANLFVSHFMGEVSALALTSTDNTTYSLDISATSTDCGQIPSWLSIDVASSTLYCSDEWWNDDSTINALSFGPDGSFTEAAQTTAKSGSVHNGLYTGADGAQFLANSHYTPSTVTTYALPLEDGSEILQTLEFTMDGPGPDPRQDAPHPHQVLQDPTGDYVVIPDLGADLIRVFTIDKSTGNLEDCPPINTTAGAGPRHARFWNPPAAAPKGKGKAAAPEGTFMYVTNELSNTVSAFEVTYPEGGCLTGSELQTLSPYPGDEAGPEGSSTAEVEISGNSVYVSNRGDASFDGNDSLARFSIGEEGSLTFEEITSSYGVFPRSFKINKAGDLVAIANQVSANVAIVARDTESGKLGEKVADLRVGDEGEAGQEAGISGIVWLE